MSLGIAYVATTFMAGDGFRLRPHVAISRAGVAQLTCRLPREQNCSITRCFEVLPGHRADFSDDAWRVE